MTRTSRQPSPVLRAVLGLPSEDRDDPLASWETPPSSTVHGLRSLGLQTLAELVSDTIPSQPNFVALTPAYRKTTSLPLTELTAWEPLREIVLAVFEQPVEVVAAHNALLAGDRRTLVLDTRKDQAGAGVRTSMGLVTVVAGGGGVDIYSQSVPPAAPVLAPPELDALVSGIAVEPWLQQAFQLRITAATSFQRCAAVGLVARLWQPVPVDLAVARALVLTGKGPRGVARQWGRGLNESERSALTASLLAEVKALSELLADLDLMVAADEEQGAVALSGWLHRRDDAESVAWLLRAGGELVAVDAALTALDRAAALHHSAWSAAGPLEDDRLRAVACQEPEQWWGQFADL